MVRIVRTGRIIQKLAKGGRVLSASTFKTLEDAKEFEELYRIALKKRIPFEVGMKISSKILE
jgi:hypothetical protein